MKDWKPIKLEELSGDANKVYDTLSKESDFVGVLIGASYLGELLATILGEHFIACSTSAKLLDPQRGALGSFATRSDLAYCLGLINKMQYHDLIKSQKYEISLYINI